MKLPVKRISAKELSSIVKVPEKLDLGVVLNRIHTYYCEMMNKRSYCTRTCSDCESALCNIIYSTKDCNIRDPYALIVWSSREEFAERDELSERSAVPLTNALGERVDVNPFDLLLKNL